MDATAFHAGIDTAASQRVTALALVLVEQGQCDGRTIERARMVAAETGQRLDAVLIQLGLVTERGLSRAFAALLKLELAGPDRYPDMAVLPDLLKPRFLRQARALPVAIEGERLVVAVADPLDEFTQAAIAAVAGRKVSLEVAVPIELDAAFDRLYPNAPAQEPTTDGAGGASEDDAERLKDLASEAPVIRLVNQIIFRAVELRASDIHVEPFEDRLRVRYRSDGMLHEAEHPPPHLTAAIISRIKIMARMDIAERRLPQDGRIKLAVRGTEIDFRVSTVPTLHGETVALRILDRTAVAFDYIQLGLPAQVIASLNTALNEQNGIVLVTGPTGSGKTTTLYAALRMLNSVDRKIVTIEDPIEYQLFGINQSQVKPQIGLGFANLLRTIVRQDPNVIMVGEIRDAETAQFAAHAALTGHLVLSTVHTNSAAATITRLREMGLEDYLLTAVLRGVVAQRLVRRLCNDCKREFDAPGELVHRFALDSRGVEGPLRLWHATGCARCRQTGYVGRQAIAEFLTPDREIERLIFGRAEHSEIERAAISGGMVPMFGAGLDAALAGTTTLEEVVRCIRAEA